MGVAVPMSRLGLAGVQSEGRDRAPSARLHWAMATEWDPLYEVAARHAEYIDANTDVEPGAEPWASETQGPPSDRLILLGRTETGSPNDRGPTGRRLGQDAPNIKAVLAVRRAGGHGLWVDLTKKMLLQGKNT